MERHFDEALGGLKKEILEMGTQVQKAIADSVEALKSVSVEQARGVIARDQVIDEWELKVDETCLDLLALQQPVALDLRFIAMAMKISTDLERMADLAVDIAQRVVELGGKPLLKPLVDIPKLSDLAQEMTRDSLYSFVGNDAALARQVIQRDAQADALRNMVQDELIKEYIARDKSTTARAIPLLLVARHLERICDHATNIAEDVIYMVQARVVKHHHEDLVDPSNK